MIMLAFLFLKLLIQAWQRPKYSVEIISRKIVQKYLKHRFLAVQVSGCNVDVSETNWSVFGPEEHRKSAILKQLGKVLK